MKDVRKFRDSFLGKDILVGPKQFIFTDKPPMESDVWKVENTEKPEKKKLNQREVKKMDKKNLENDSGSS